MDGRVSLFAGRDVLTSGAASILVGRYADVLAGRTIAGGGSGWTPRSGTYRPNHSVFIDDAYVLGGGPLNIVTEGSIFVMTNLVVNGDINFEAEHIVVTDQGSMMAQLGGGVNLLARGSLQLGGNVAAAGNMSLTALDITQGESTLLRGNLLSVQADLGYRLFTDVVQLSARVLGEGNMAVNNLNGLELLRVDIPRGELRVASGGDIVARDVQVRDLHHTNQIHLTAAGSIAMEIAEPGRRGDLFLNAGGEVSQLPARSGIEGRKWDDQDGNGEWDQGEPGLAGITVYLDLNENGARDDDEPFLFEQFRKSHFLPFLQYMEIFEIADKGAGGLAGFFTAIRSISLSVNPNSLNFCK